MLGRFKRRGQTWQSPEWRRPLLATADLNDRARLGLIRIEVAPRVPQPESLSYSLARMTAPFVGDGISAGGAFSIRPEFRGFA